MNRKYLLLMGLAVFLYGCPRAQKYDRPTLPVPTAWPESAVSQASVPAAPMAADTEWRVFFADTKLQSVIELALANNRDLRMASLNIEKVEALYRIQRAQIFPTVSVLGNVSGERVPSNVSGKEEPQNVTQYVVGLGISSWELDFFKRIRSLTESALEQYFATEQARTSAQISLVAAVANSYLALAADRDNLRLTQATFDAQQASYEMILASRNLGIASDLDLRQAQSLVEAARVDIVRYAGQVTLDENALNLLAGTPVSSSLLPSELGSDRALKDINAGLPSDVLLRRPDILLAEHQLKAAYANIAAARAAYFPRITLTAGAGLLSSDLADLFTLGAKTWDFAPQVVLPIFDMGARKANYKVAQVDRDIAIAEYEKAIQAAFREVSDSLSLRSRLVEQQKAQQSLVDTLAETCRLSEARYKAGIDSYLSVLVAQRSLYVAQQGMVSLRLARMSNLVGLYKALGGGA
jgi:multidrug efflux system outer membrane protein